MAAQVVCKYATRQQRMVFNFDRAQRRRLVAVVRAWRAHVQLYGIAGGEMRAILHAHADRCLRLHQARRTAQVSRRRRHDAPVTN